MVSVHSPACRVVTAGAFLAYIFATEHAATLHAASAVIHNVSACKTSSIKGCCCVFAFQAPIDGYEVTQVWIDGKVSHLAIFE